MKSLSYFITSLTPIVTGDHRHRNTDLQATGLLGSLRYQYWLLKAMQAWQHNPHNPSYPPYSADLPAKGNRDDFKRDLRKAGPVVLLFGATNWKKMFRLEIGDAEKVNQQACSARSDTQKNKDVAPWKWQFSLNIRQDRKISFLGGAEGDQLQNEMEELMSFIHQYGWLGAAPQNGLGWVQIQGQAAQKTPLRPDNPVFAAKDVIFSKKEAESLRQTLEDFFQDKLKKPAPHWKHGRYRHSLEHLRENSPPIGYEIRRWLREHKQPTFFFGSKKHGGFIHVSHPVVQQDQGWLVRLRFAVRPENGGGLTPARITPPPESWLDHCEQLLKSV